MGCQQIAKDIIDFIVEDGTHNLVGVIEHDEERDRVFGKLVREHCADKGIQTYRIENKEALLAHVKSAMPDIIFSIYYRKIIPQSVIDTPPMGCINIHPAALPRYRGPNPTYFSVLNGDETAGTTIHYIDAGMDTGDIIAQKLTAVEERTGFELNKHMMNVGVELFKDNYRAIMSGVNSRKKQDDSIATCVVPLRSENRYISWMKTAEQIVQHIRAHAPPYASCIARTENSEVSVMEARVLNQNRSSRGPGCYEIQQDGHIIVQTHAKPLLITKWTGNISPKGRFI